MNKQPSDEVLESVLQQIRDNPGKKSAGGLSGDTEQNLLAIRELRRRGLITGVFLDDSTRPGDHHGRFLYDAARLEPL
ncbi:hypothetical protein EQ836_07765 [Ectopseudomonas mendocina]|uniref:Uncharacterized protein n=1 Tax=Ectopseudomonas mendocina TaxID=300 RepID=A0ABD7S3C2_ECTME|nr:hypothetical protein EQ829_10160 [Pseudomonas mendocina]TRO19411.1 hypothetical protein EQ836_07765 [Pseudomonas mendocina]